MQTSMLCFLFCAPRSNDACILRNDEEPYL